MVQYMWDMHAQIRAARASNVDVPLIAAVKSHPARSINIYMYIIIHKDIYEHMYIYIYIYIYIYVYM